jgi:hypothetical protein
MNPTSSSFGRTLPADRFHTGVRVGSIERSIERSIGPRMQLSSPPEAVAACAVVAQGPPIDQPAHAVAAASTC